VKPRTVRRRRERRREASPENFKKVDAILCNLADIFGIKNSSDFGHYKIQIQFQKYFPYIVYNVKNKIDFAKNRGEAWTPESVTAIPKHLWRGFFSKRRYNRIFLGCVEFTRYGLLQLTIPSVRRAASCANTAERIDLRGPKEQCIRREFRFLPRIRCGLRQITLPLV